MLKVTEKGSFNNLEKYLKKSVSVSDRTRKILDRYGREGVRALSAATPSRTGATANSWSYYIEQGKSKSSVIWTNSNEAPGASVPVAILIQYGHMTRNGGYVQGIDFINPALRGVFKDMANAIYREVVE